MASQVYLFPCTVPVGTTIAFPIDIAMTMPACIVRAIEIRVPPGPKGEVGFAIGNSGRPVIPANVGQWLITDDEVIAWNLDAAITSGGWDCLMYNTGTYPHTIYVRFFVDPPTDTNPANTGTILSPDDIMAAAQP